MASFHGDILEQIHDGVVTSVHRARTADGQSVLLKIAKATSSRAADVGALRHQHAILEELVGAEVARSLGLVEIDGHPALILEDFGGTSLRNLGIAGKLSLVDWLSLATKLVDMLASVHARSVIHRDVNPSNIVLRASDGAVRLIDFGIATRLPQEVVPFGPATRLEGTLLYMSPEQTGRINRPVDYRTDYYSLGATLYELLTGRPPFDGTDALELVHCHIARRPPSPGAVRQAVPEPVCEILLKLLAKAATDRYQSSVGLRHDLTHCLAEVGRSGTVASFPLGARDVPEGFRSSQRHYGRDADVERLVSVLQRPGGSLTLVTGPSGIGKTALIQELHRPLTLMRGAFVAGKFDPQRASVPYEVVTHVVEALVADALSQSQKDLDRTVELLRETLGVRLGALAELCPSLSLLAGDIPAPPALPPADAQARLARAVSDFVSIFVTREHPLCVFFDDLQWVDPGSLAVIEEILRSLREQPLFVIGAYRDGEVGEAHPLRSSLRALEADGVRVERLALGPLGRADVTAMVMDTLATSRENASELSALLDDKTGGNPFFLKSFLRSLYTDGLLVRSATGFQWDVQRIAQRGVTDNVVELLAGRIQSLPEATRRAMLVGACVGAVFDLGTLSLVLERQVSETGDALWSAVDSGLLLPLAPAPSRVAMQAAPPSLQCRFAHDRIQQAVVSLLDPGALANIKYEIGARLLAALSPEDLARRMFEVIGYLDAGRAAVIDRAERHRFAELNLRAARLALRAPAPQQTLAFALAGIDFLGEQGWTEASDLMRSLHQVAAEAAFLSSEIETLSGLSTVLLLHARDAADEVFVLRLEGQAHYSQQRLSEAMRAYVRALGLLGTILPEEPTEADSEAEWRATRDALAGREFESLSSLPVCAGGAALQVMQILNHLILLGYSLKSPLHAVAVSRLVRASLEHGNIAESALGYVNYASHISTEGEHLDGARCARVALRIADRFGDEVVSAQAYLYANALVLGWTTPPAEMTIAHMETYRHSVAGGGPFYVAGSATTVCIHRFLSGDSLAKLSPDMQHYSQVIKKLRQPLVLNWHEPYQQAVHNLREDTDEPLLFRGPHYSEADRVPVHVAAGDPSALMNYYFCKAYVCLVFGDVAGALAAVESNIPLAPIMSVALWALPWAFLSGIVALLATRGEPVEERDRLLGIAIGARDRLRAWAPLCPAAGDHKLAILEVEILRAQGHTAGLDARYEGAASLAAASGMTGEHAIICEVAARFYLERSHPKLARKYVRDAHHAYLRWGAVAKVRAMEREHPQFLPRLILGDLASVTLSAGSFLEQDLDVLDFVGVLEASQALSREVGVDRILVRLMELVLSSSGAEAGYLLRESGGAWRIEVRASLDGVATESAPRGVDLGRSVALSVVSYVARTREVVALDDAGREVKFARDPRFGRDAVRSVLCFPLLRENETIGVIYLENNLIEGAFTPSRVGILQILGAQAVISLENATLYETMEQKVESRTQELQRRNDELAVTLVTLRETQDRMVVQERLASLGSMVAGIAHELRNPLNFVNNFAELSAKLLSQIKAHEPSPGDPTGKLFGTLEQNLQRIREHGQRMDGVIRSMLEHSRSGEGQKQPISVNAFVEKYANLAYQGQSTRTPYTEIAFDLKLDPAVQSVSAVPQELSRVLINLLDNASYAVRKKKERPGAEGFLPVISLSTAMGPGGVEIRVRDNGVGIRRDLLGQVCNPFFTTKEAGEGTGLGLSLSHDIVVKGYGGSLWIDSVEGDFTEVAIILPVSR